MHEQYYRIEERLDKVACMAEMLRLKIFFNQIQGIFAGKPQKSSTVAYAEMFENFRFFPVCVREEQLYRLIRPAKLCLNSKSEDEVQ